MRLLQISDEVIDIGRAHGPSWHGIVKLFAGRIYSQGDGASQRFVIVTAMITMTVFVMCITFKQCLRSQRGCLYPELRPESFSFPFRTMTGDAAGAVHTHMKVHVATTTTGADRAARDAATGKIDTFAIGDIR